MELRLHILRDYTDDRADRRGRFVKWTLKKSAIMLVMILCHDVYANIRSHGHFSFYFYTMRCGIIYN